MQVKDSVALVTGANRGIGEAFVRELVAAGAAHVYAAARDAASAAHLEAEFPGQVTAVQLDVSQPGQIAAIAAARPDVSLIVNNAGAFTHGLLIGSPTLAGAREEMEVNYFGPVALTKAALPALRAQRGGHIVVVSSVMGYLGTPGRSTYAAAKHALHGYFDSLRAEVWRDGLAVTLACPGYVRTAVSANALGPRGAPHGATDRSTERGIAPERCAAAIVRAVARRCDEVYVGGREVAGIYLKRYFPGLLARIVRRMKFSVSS